MRRKEKPNLLTTCTLALILVTVAYILGVGPAVWIATSFPETEPYLHYIYPDIEAFAGTPIYDILYAYNIWWMERSL